MSRRHPAVARTTSTRQGKNFRRLAIDLAWHLRNRTRLQRLQKLTRARGIVFGIGREDDQKEAIFAGHRETRHVEHRVIRHWQAVEREHSKHGGDSAEKNREFE